MAERHPAHAAASPGPNRAEPKRRGNGIYLTLWCLAGLAATGYLVMLALGKPALLDAGATAVINDDSGPVTLRAGARDVGAAQGYEALSRDVANLKANVSALEAGIGQLSRAQTNADARITDIEAWRSTVTTGPGETLEVSDSGTVTPSASVAQPVDDASAIEGTTLDGDTRTLPPTPAPTPVETSRTNSDDAILAALFGNTEEQAAPATPQTETAALTPEVAPQPAPLPASLPIPGRRTFGVELGSGDSVDSLRLKWALLNERHRDLIGSLAPRFVRTGNGPSTLYRLIAGPFSSTRQASELCTQLNAYYVPCSTSAFTGAVL
ncbi:MAG: hypothetical protein AAGJ70_02580 [Pseudomonadota bacterium]